MLQQILVFEKSTGIILYDKSFGKISADDPLKEGYGMFFVGLQSLISELIKEDESIKTIELEEFYLDYTSIEDIGCALVIVAKKKAKKKVSKLIPHLISLLYQYKPLFKNINDIATIKKIENPISELLRELNFIGDWISFI